MMMRKAEGDEELTGNDRFEGYCKDMMDLIAKKLGINCKILQLAFLIFHSIFIFHMAFCFTDELRRVKDQKYGNENANVTGGWDGIIGELVRRVSYFKMKKQ